MIDKKLPDWWHKLNKCSCIYVPSSICFLVTSGVVCLLSLIFFIMFISSQTTVVTYRERYDDLPCNYQGVNPCTFSIKIDEDMEGPVFVYYELRNFFQNHRIYARSFDLAQLTGEDSVSENCDPVSDIGDLQDHMDDHALNLLVNERSADADPCGLIAASFFNDTFALSNSQGTPINLDVSDIVYMDDKDLYDNSGSEWVDKEEEHFQVWMRPAQYSNFMKLYAKIDDDLRRPPS